MTSFADVGSPVRSWFGLKYVARQPCRLEHQVDNPHRLMHPADPAAFLPKLYTIFASYPFCPGFEHRCSPVTPPTSAEITALAKPIRRISSGDVSRYAFKALTTWGDEADLRHFLPRLCELLCNKEYPWDPELLLDKLLYAKSSSWPDDELLTLREFFCAFAPQHAASRHRHLSQNFFERLAFFCGSELLLERWSGRRDEDLLLLGCAYLQLRPQQYGPLFALSVYNQLFCDEAMSERLTAFFFRTTDPWLQTFISDGIAGLEERLAR